MLSQEKMIDVLYSSIIVFRQIPRSPLAATSLLMLLLLALASAKAGEKYALPRFMTGTCTIISLNQFSEEHNCYGQFWIICHDALTL